MTNTIKVSDVSQKAIQKGLRQLDYRKPRL